MENSCRIDIDFNVLNVFRIQSLEVVGQSMKDIGGTVNAENIVIRKNVFGASALTLALTAKRAGICASCFFAGRRIPSCCGRRDIVLPLQ